MAKNKQYLFCLFIMNNGDGICPLTEPYSELKHWNLIIFNKNELIFFRK